MKLKSKLNVRKKAKKSFLSLRERSILNVENNARKHVLCWTNGLRYKYTGNRMAIVRFIKPHQYTHAGYPTQDKQILRMVGLSNYQACRMLQREIVQIYIDQYKEKYST